ncbi:MAG: RidA family protein [Coriobacteriia bacterium]|nr:RidA family protein [Coriobacteriia bacterium]
MSEVAARLAAAGYELPPAPGALGSYVPAVLTDRLVFTAGQLPLRAGQLLASGIVGAEIDPEQARACAEQAALNALAAASTVCDLDDVERVVKLTGYVASTAGFTAQPSVVDGASAVMLAAFGEAGRHARAAVGVIALPLGAPVEIEIVLALR